MDTNVKGAERTLAHLSMFLWFGIMLLYFENNGTMKALIRARALGLIMRPAVMEAPAEFISVHVALMF
jgi:hypothetical protein